MRYIARYMLDNGGILYSIVNASSEASVKSISVRKSSILKQNMRLNSNIQPSIEKWSTNTKSRVVQGGNHAFEYYIVNSQGILDGGKIQSQGVKTAVNSIVSCPKYAGLHATDTIFLYDLTESKAPRRSGKKKSSVAAEETLSSKSKTIEVYTDAMRKSKAMQSNVITKDLSLMLSMIIDYKKGDYKRVPWGTILAVTATVLYFVSPIDIIPDVCSVFYGAGFVDDAGFMLYALHWVHDDLVEYEHWKNEQEGIPNKDTEQKQLSEA